MKLYSIDIATEIATAERCEILENHSESFFLTKISGKDKKHRQSHEDVL